MLNININFINNPNEIKYECESYTIKENCLVLFKATNKTYNSNQKYYEFISYPLITLSSFYQIKTEEINNNNFINFKGGR